MIAAAGSGERLAAGGPKAFVELAGRSLLERSIAAIADSVAISSLIIAVPAELVGTAQAALEDGPALPLTVLSGGASRAESVRLAVEAVDAELVVVHDAARPLASPELFDAVVARLAAEPDADAVIAAAPLHDTVKRSAARNDGAEPGEVAETLAREHLWAAQTPQAFRVSALRAAQQRAQAEGRLEQATDEAGLIELAGGRVLLEPAPAHNLKVTTAADLRIAAAILDALGRV